MKRIFLLLSVLAVMVGCSPKIQYIGKSYKSTNDVDIFFDKNDVKRDYEVMGKVDGVGGMVYSSFDDIQSEIMKVARRKGADGIIVYNMEQRVLGNSSNSDTKIDNNTPDAFGQSARLPTTARSGKMR